MNRSNPTWSPTWAPTWTLKARRLVASLGSLGLSLIFFVAIRNEHPQGAQWIPLGMVVATPVIAAVAIWCRPLGAQLLARGICWSYLLLGGLISVSEGCTGRPDDLYVVYVTTCAAVALLVAGGTGLSQDGGAFQPVAFRGTLLLALVLAMADTTSFSWFGIINVMRSGNWGILVLVPFMVAGVIGLLRLRTWGLLVSLSANLLVAICSATGLFDMPRPFRVLFISTAVIQLLVPLPMLISIARRRTPAPDGWRRAKRVTSALVVVGIVVLSAYCNYFRATPLFVP